LVELFIEGRCNGAELYKFGFELGEVAFEHCSANLSELLTENRYPHLWLSTRLSPLLRLTLAFGFDSLEEPLEVTHLPSQAPSRRSSSEVAPRGSRRRP